MTERVHGVPVFGVDVDSETRCAHYHDDHDVIAIKFACCGDYYPCHACHDAHADHDSMVWERDQLDTPAVLCGACGAEFSITDYRSAADACPACGHDFNPGCAAHAHLYFETQTSSTES